MIIDKINEQIIADYKSGNNQRRVLYQTLKASLLNKQKDLKEKYNEDEEVKILKNELKQRQEALQQFTKANRNDLAKTNQEEIALIQELLPEQMSDGDVERIVKEKIQELDDRSFGNVMKAVMQDLKGKADGGLVSELVKKNLE